MLLRDGVRCHPKVLKAGAEAAWLWACCIDYSRQQLTDGFVPDEALPTLAACKSKLSDLTARLTAVGLLHREAAGFRVHDYLDHNDSAEKVRDDKRKDAERKRGGRPPESAPNPDGIHTESQRTLARARGVGVGNTPEGGSGGNGTAILAGHRSHRSHALCGRVCMPAFVYTELVRKRGGDEAGARRYVDEWFTRVTQAIPEDMCIAESEPDYWRRRWALDHAASLPSSADVPAPRLPKARDVLAAQGIPAGPRKVVAS